MIEALLKMGVSITVFDPEAMNNVKQKFGNKISFSNSMYDAVNKVDALIISTEWSIFRNPDFTRLKNNMNQPVIFDGRNLYEIEDMEREGFYYSSIGRKEVSR